MQSYIAQELSKPSKNWVHDVVTSKRECENVKMRTEDFVLLPDTNAQRRIYRQCPKQLPLQWGAASAGVLPRWASMERAPLQPLSENADGAAVQQVKTFNWLAIVTDPGLRSVRDLHGKHIPMLEAMHEKCLEFIEGEYGVGRSDVMVYANYPPSVYRLHFHFCAPFLYSSAFDAFRMHSMSGILNNLRIDRDYYQKSCFHFPVHVTSDLFRALTAGSREDDSHCEDSLAT